MTTTNNIFYGNNCVKNNRQSSSKPRGEVKIFWISKSWKNQLKQLFQPPTQDEFAHVPNATKTKELHYSNTSLGHLKNKYLHLKYLSVKDFIHKINWSIISYLKLGIGLIMSAYALFMFDAQMGIIASFYLAQTLTNTTIHTQRNSVDKNTDTHYPDNDIIDIEYETIT